jgi:hypothetical protein
MNEFTITFDQSRFDVDAIHAFLTKAYWCVGIPHEVVRKAIEGSLSYASGHWPINNK